MASLNKTPILGLNKWEETDKPKRIDFNNDNLQIENIVGTHLQNQKIHVTEEEKKYLQNSIYIGSYKGFGNYEYGIALDFSPKLVLIFSVSNSALIGFACKTACSAGIHMEENNVIVSAGNALNKSEETYLFAAFK